MAVKKGVTVYWFEQDVTMINHFVLQTFRQIVCELTGVKTKPNNIHWN